MNFQNDVHLKLVPLLNQAIAELRQDLESFRTWQKNSRLHESTLSFYVGRLFRSSGFLYFPEIPINRDQEITGKGNAFDGIAFEPHSKTGILIECKYLFPGSIASLIKDLRRMHFEKPLDRFQLLGGEKFQTGLILVHSARQPIHEWWMSDLKEGEIPERKKNSSLWNSLGHVLRSGAKGGGLIVEPDKKGGPVWMMWCLFSLNCLETIFGKSK